MSPYVQYHQFALTDLALLSVACSARDKSTAPPEQPNSDGFVTASLPYQAAAASCNPQAKEPTLCDWAGRNDAVIFARIVGVSLARSPFIMSGPTSDPTELRDEVCTGSANVALRIALHVEDVLWGSAPLGSLSVAIGSNQVGEWNPTPFGAIHGTNPGWDGDNPVVPLQPGGTLFLGITRESTRNEWSVLGEYLYTFDIFGKLVAVEAACATEATDFLASPHYDVLKAGLTSCPTQRSDAATKALEGKRKWSANPLVGVAALCFEPSAPTSPDSE